MYELVYSSIAKKEISEQEVIDILNTARDFNSKNNITGCLVFHKNEFIQVLEGDKDKVKILFENIEKDNRHYNVLLINEGEKTERLFKNWTMVYYKFDQNDLDNIQRKLFIENFITISKLADISSNASKMFWYISKNLMREL